jgi:hypothetical protein
MKKIIYSALFFFLFISCDNKKESTTPETTKDSSVVTPPVTETLQKVTYVSATYYTGRVDFYFKDENGVEVIVGISNFPEDNGAPYPPELLESGEDVEGPPGENPAMVGKKFYLVKDTTGKLTEIRTVK